MKGRLMTLNILGVALLNRLTIVVRAGREIDPTKPWDVVMMLHIRIDAGIKMQLWTP